MKVRELLLRLQAMPQEMEVEFWCPDGYEDTVTACGVLAGRDVVTLAGAMGERHPERFVRTLCGCCWQAKAPGGFRPPDPACPFCDGTGELRRTSPEGG